MFKDMEMQQFYSSLVSKGMESNRAVETTILRFEDRLIVKFEFPQFKRLKN